MSKTMTQINRLKRYYKSSVFNKIILIFIIMIVVLYVLGTGLYLLSTSLLRAEISNNMSNQMKFYLDNMENEIMRIRTMQIEFMNDEDLNYLANANSIMWDYEKTMAEQRVERRLHLFKYSSALIDQAVVHIPEMGKTISSNEGLTDLSVDYSSSLEHIKLNGAQSLELTAEGWYLYSAYPIRLTYENEPIYIVVSELSQKEINKIFSTSVSTFGGTFAHSLENDIYWGLVDEVKNLAITQVVFEGSNGTQVISIPGQGRYLVNKIHSEYLNLDYYGYVSEDEAFSSAKRIASIFIVFSLAIVAIVVMFTRFSSKTVHQPVALLVGAFTHLEKGNLDIRIEPQSEDEFRYLYEAFNEMVESLNKLVTQVSNYKVLTREAQLKQLQAQISPHFLYNCLFIIYRMAQIGDMENVVLFSRHLNNYYRYITRDAKNEVPLIEEFQHAQDYTAIQQIRFSNRIKIEWDDLPELYFDLIVPRLIMQPLIENAFTHGLKNIISDGILEIRVSAIENGVCIDVINNGVKPTEEEMVDLNQRITDLNYPGEITALRNIHRRVLDTFGSESGLSPFITEKGFFCMRLKIMRISDAEIIDS